MKCMSQETIHGEVLPPENKCGQIICGALCGCCDAFKGAIVGKNSDAARARAEAEFDEDDFSETMRRRGSDGSKGTLDSDMTQSYAGSNKFVDTESYIYLI